MDTITLIVILFVVTLTWALFSLSLLYYIKAEGRKHYKKNKEIYPYFSYPLYKRMFLLGLRGTVSKFIIILTFAVNIITLLCLVLCIVLLIHFNIYVSYCFRAAVGIQLILLLLKTILLVFDMPKL